MPQKISAYNVFVTEMLAMDFIGLPDKEKMG